MPTYRKYVYTGGEKPRSTKYRHLRSTSTNHKKRRKSSPTEQYDKKCSDLTSKKLEEASIRGESSSMCTRTDGDTYLERNWVVYLHEDSSLGSNEFEGESSWDENSLPPGWEGAHELEEPLTSDVNQSPDGRLIESDGNEVSTSEDESHMYCTEISFQNPVASEEATHEEILPSISDGSVTGDEESFANGFHDDEKETICPCTWSTVDDVCLMVLSLGVRHHMTWAAQVDILKMVNAMYGHDKIPCSKFKFFKYVDRSADKFNFHIYCNFCETYLGAKTELGERVTCHCETDVEVSSAPFFLSIDIESQIRDLLHNEKLRELLLTYRFKRKKTNPEGLEDILDGRLYQEHCKNDAPLSSPYNFSFSFNTDGASTGKSTGKSVWPIYIVLNELPPQCRYCHVLLAGLYVGKTDPKQSTFLQPFVAQCNKLASDGFAWQHNGKNVISRVLPTCAVVDSVARWQILNMSGVNSFYACTFCYHKAECTRVGQMFPPSLETVPLRTAESTKMDMRKAYEQRNSNPKERVIKGVKGPTPLLRLNFFHLIDGFVPDYLHCILLGVVKAHTEMLLEPSRKKFWKCMPDNTGEEHLISCIDERLSRIHTLTAITRAARPLSQMAIWKASEWRSWLLFYSLPCLNGLLKEKYLIHLDLLSKGTYILLNRSVQKDEVNKAHSLFLRYIFMCDKYFGTSSCRLNVHLLNHVAQGVLNWGPLWTHNTFPFEGQNRFILQLLQGPGAVCQQIARKFLIFNSLPQLIDNLASGPKTMKFCGGILERKLKHFMRCADTLLLGKGEHLPLSREEINCLEQYKMDEVDGYISYGRMLLHGARYSTRDTAKGRLRDDSHIITLNRKYGVITKILVSPIKKVVIIVREIITQEMLDVGDHVKQISGYGSLCCIQGEDVLAQCVFIDVGNGKYIAELPYGCSGD